MGGEGEREEEEKGREPRATVTESRPSASPRGTFHPRTLLAL